jgi:cell fate (sporulation/competence/biofilm development) regulator YlbF (YheA/YmcA/DUF963 family)
VLNILSSDLQLATHSLIEYLLASEAFMHYQQVRNRIDQDSEVRTLLEYLSKAQSDLRQNQSSGSVDQTKLESLGQLQQRLESSPVITNFAQSHHEIIGLLREINSEISEVLGINFASFTSHATC